MVDTVLWKNFFIYVFFAFVLLLKSYSYHKRLITKENKTSLAREVGLYMKQDGLIAWGMAILMAM